MRWRDDAAAEKDPGFLSLLLEGSRMLQQGDANTARTRLEQALRLRPQNEKARNLLGQTYFKMGNLDAAERVFKALSREYPREPTLRLNLALVYIKRGRMNDARDELEALYTMHPGHQKALSYLGLVYERLGNLARARWAFLLAGSTRLASEMESKLLARGLPLDPGPVPQPEPDEPTPTERIQPAPPPEPTPEPATTELPDPPTERVRAAKVEEKPWVPPVLEHPVPLRGRTRRPVAPVLVTDESARAAVSVVAAAAHAALNPLPAVEMSTEDTVIVVLAQPAHDEPVPEVLSALPAEATPSPELPAEPSVEQPAAPPEPPPSTATSALPRLLSAMAAENDAGRGVTLANKGADQWAPGATADSMVMALTHDPMTGDQWLQRRSIPPPSRPFAPIAPGLLGLAVDGQVLIRATTLASMQGDINTAPAQRKGDDGTTGLLGGDQDPVVVCYGSGQISLDPGAFRVAVLKVDGGEATVLESALFGCSSGLTREDITLTLDLEGPRIAAVRFTGAGVVAVRSASSVRAVPCQKGVPLRVSMEHLLAFEGALTWVAAPAVAGLPNLVARAAVLEGQGVVLLRAGTRP